MQYTRGQQQPAWQGQQPQWRPPYPSHQPRPGRGANPWLITAAVIGGLVLLGGIVTVLDGGPKEPTASASPAVQAVPSPDASQRAAYLGALAEIDPGLVVNEERAIRRAMRICDRIINPQSGMSLERYTVAELSGGNATIDEGQARQVIKAVRVWCR